MRVLLTVIICCIVAGVYAQDVSKRVLDASFERRYEEQPKPKKLLVFRKKNSRYNPVMYAGAAFLFIYQRIFSEQIQAECMYQVSCSEYTKYCIQQKGLVRGMLAGFNQVTECFNGAVYEHPPMFIHKSRIVNVHAGSVK
jgi:uncharacterized protein